MATLPTSPNDLTPEQLFLGHLKLIEEIIRHCCRRSRLSPQEGEEFRGTVMLKLIDENYPVFRQYRGDSAIGTYLSVVIGRLLLDYQNHIWTKWRNSAEAGRLGPVAQRLERLLGREGFTLQEAYQILRGEGLEMSESELADLRARLPPKIVRRFVGEEILQLKASHGLRPDQEFEMKERSIIKQRVLRVLDRVLKSLPAEDLLLVGMRTKLSVADIARLRRMEQKPLYRRLTKIYKELRKAMEREGIRKQDIEDILGGSLGPGFLDF
jgi:RNA polymerase sigma factor (sigma-70 family)